MMSVHGLRPQFPNENLDVLHELQCCHYLLLTVLLSPYTIKEVMWEGRFYLSTRGVANADFSSDHLHKVGPWVLLSQELDTEPREKNLK